MLKASTALPRATVEESCSLALLCLLRVLSCWSEAVADLSLLFFFAEDVLRDVLWVSLAPQIHFLKFMLELSVWFVFRFTFHESRKLNFCTPFILSKYNPQLDSTHSALNFAHIISIPIPSLEVGSVYWKCCSKLIHHCSISYLFLCACLCWIVEV